MEIVEEIKYNLRNNRETQLSVGFALVVAIGAGAYYTYKWYSSNLQKNAQRAFSESMEIYNQAALSELKLKEAKDKKNLWDEAEIAFTTGYEQNRRSKLAPFFLIYESDVQAKQGKFEESYKKLKEAVEKLPKGSSYYYLYKIKLALLEIDKNFGKGLSDLEEIAADKNNNLKDMANFFLGEYFLSNNNIEKAEEHYKIAQSFNSESPWGMQSKMRLSKMGKAHDKQS